MACPYRSRTPDRAPWDAANDDFVRSSRATASTGMADPACCRAPIRQSRLQRRRADGQLSGPGVCLFPATDDISPSSAAAHKKGLDSTASEAERLAAATNKQCAALNGSFWSFLACSSRRAAAEASADPAPGLDPAETVQRTPAREDRPREHPDGQALSGTGWRVLLDEAAGGKRRQDNDERAAAEETARAKRGRPVLPR